MLQGFGSGCTGDSGGEGSVHVEVEFVPFSACSFFPASLLHRGAWGRDLTQDHDMRPLNLPRSLSDRPHSTARVSITPLLVSLGFRWQNLSQAPRDRRDAWNTWTRGTRGTLSAPFCSHIPRQDPRVHPSCSTQCCHRPLISLQAAAGPFPLRVLRPSPAHAGAWTVSSGASLGLGGCWRWDPALCRPTWL